MTEVQTSSWIFLAAAIASRLEPASDEAISGIADGINHAVPTRQELQRSFAWLIKNNLVIKKGKKYKLTEQGQRDYEVASRKTSALLKIWDNLEIVFKKYQM